MRRVVTDARRCPKCLAHVRENDRFCSFCQSPLAAPSEAPPTEPTVEPVDLSGSELSGFSLPSPTETTGQAQLLEAWTAALGVTPEMVEARFEHLHGLARFSVEGGSVLLTLGFSEQGAALYAYEDSGLGFELVCRVRGPELPAHLVDALEALRANQGTTGQPPRPLPEHAAWSARFTPASTLGSLDTINGRVRFFEVEVEARPPPPRPETPAEQRSRLRTTHTPAESPELEAAFAARRDASSAQVYADWLQAHGDARGELAALVRGDSVVAPEWLGANADLLLGSPPLKVGEQLRGLRFEHGFLVGASLRGSSRWLLRPEDEGAPLHELTRQFLELPLARFVRRLRFGVPSRRDVDWARTLEVVTRSRQAPTILELSFDDYTHEDNELSWTPFGDFSSAWSKLPSLEHLHIRSGEGGTLGPLDLPNLRTFIRESGGLAASELADIQRAHWPKLERLDLWTGQAAYGAQASVDLLAPFFRGDGLPALRRFGLINCEFVHDAIEPLAHSPLLKRLRHLDLSGGVLTNAEVPLFLRLAEAFRHLEVLDLSQNQLGPQSDERLAALCGKVILDEQRYQPGDDGEEQAARYTAVGE